MKKSVIMKPVLLIAIALVLVLVNLAALFLPKPDMSSESALKLSDESRRYLATLDEEVNMYVIEGGVYDSKFEMFIKEYAKSSDKINLEFVDAADAGEILELCGYSASEEITAYAVVLSSEKRARLIDYYSMFYYYNPNFGQLSYSQYNQYYSMFASSESYASYLNSLMYESQYYFYGDALLTGIVEYVTVDIIPRAYIVTSHGENSASEGNFGKLLLAMGYGHGELALSDTTPIPEDAGCLIINEPTEDISKAEADAILAYLGRGGRLLLVTDEAALDMPNLISVAKHYGVSVSAGRVAESIEDKESFTLTPKLNTDHDIIAKMGSYEPKIVNANALEISGELRPSQLVTPLLVSSESAYIEGKGDDKASFTLAVAVEEVVGDKTSKLVWFTGADSFNGKIDSADSLALLVYSAAWLNESYTTKVGEISAVLYGESIMQVPEGAVLWGGVIILLGAAALIVTGAVVVYRRKRR